MTGGRVVTSRAQGTVLTPFVADRDFTLYVGDVRDVLATLPDESVHCVVTSPPYWGLRDYGMDGQVGLEETPEQYVAALVAIFGEVRRLLRPDGTLWLNLGDSYVSAPSGSLAKSTLESGQTPHSRRAHVRDGKAVHDDILRPYAVDGLGCTWRHSGTAGECRTAAAAHRAGKHPELAGARTHRKGGIKFKRRGEEVDPAVVAESRRLRQERDDAARLETITGARAARAARGQTELLEEVASARGDVGAASSSSHPAAATTTGRNPMNECKIEGCEADASDAPKAGPTAKLCAVHRAGRSAQLSADRRQAVKPPAPVPDGGTLAQLAAELEDARADLERAGDRYAHAVAAFKQHDVIKRFTTEEQAA